MICLKSPKSSEFAIFVNKQWSKIMFTMFISSYFNREIKKIKSYASCA